MGSEVKLVAAGLVLTVNAGSSSIKLDLFTCDGETIETVGASHIRNPALPPNQILKDFFSECDINVTNISIVSHRLVHGGDLITRPVMVTEALEERLDKIASLAPLHNPVAFKWVRSCRDLLPSGCPQVLVPDTAFFTDLPDVARVYAVPAELTRRHGLRRYGFHGLAHKAMWLEWVASGERPPPSRLISIQLGAGCSITATRDGRPLDTSMGFTPLEGLVMATRSGDIDAGLVTWLQRNEALSADEVDRVLNEWSGLYGLSGISGDVDVLLNNGSPDAMDAIAIYAYRIRKYIGALLAVMNGTDGILFGGGVGEHIPYVRARALEAMEWAGIEMDEDRNAAHTRGSGILSTDTSPVEVRATRVEEAGLLASEALALLIEQS